LILDAVETWQSPSTTAGKNSQKHNWRAFPLRRQEPLFSWFPESIELIQRSVAVEMEEADLVRLQSKVAWDSEPDEYTHVEP
jgi:hypothetical protein